MRCAALVLAVTGSLLINSSQAFAHAGPPYPIVSNKLVGQYRISVWTDPDTTDDEAAGGQFWVVIDPARAGDTVSADVRAEVTIWPLDRTGEKLSARAAAVRGNVSRQFVALRMDHEGRFAVRVELQGVADRASVDSEVQATYDLRPSRFMLVVYLLPFLLAGVLWTTLLVRRRRAHIRAG